MHRLLEVLAPSKGCLIDSPCPACGYPLPLDPWYHLLESYVAFPAHVPVASYPWLALGRGFGVHYALISAMACYLPVVEISRALLLTGAGDLGQFDLEEGPETKVSLGGELLEVASLGDTKAEGEQTLSLAFWRLPAPLLEA